ncbi:peptidoglycan glycosyltransferase [Rhodobacter aestuarii]|uniref:Peptidoglycan glycosyltransferase n=1 Tax=Rhodobacter aestuarii TaxID=453582 RepID=A0A1N7KXA5_9RHOB|nr:MULTISPECIES: penicillin-binding protein 2 [Rhodobacter]PTV95526.1 peptidoglycan glycosyltransferase [Rhodobacter aestuarii]SIS66040.1 peptidoglycan glycosyltransferase [Rhodobacter aestuarii]SOB89673.1 peptidoglycan glycosyltransferase [Rhodobacter sp. JA431]
MKGLRRRNTAATQASRTTITRRGLMLGAAQAAIVATLGLRMRHMQLDQADEYRMLAEGNSVKIRLIPPARGLIYDRNGVLLAGNEQNYRVTMTREDADDVEQELADLRRLIPITDDEAEELLDELKRRPPNAPITLADRLSWEEFSRVAVNAPALAGVTPEVGLSRFYPHGPDFAHVIGYVGPVSDYDLSKLENPDPLLRIPRFQLGKSGVEAKLEDDLRGKAGQRRVEVNSAGREMRELGRREGDPGTALQLTLDTRLQNFALARLGEESAAAVVMDVTNGDVLAISSAPSFDPNLFVRGISSADYKALMEDDHRPLADKTVQGLYPPGSTFKMVTLMAALEAGVIGPEETVRCPGYVEYGGRRFNCWKRAGHGRVNAWQSLEQSCDVYFYEVSQKVGIEAISAMARKLGIGVRHDLPMSAVAEGNAPTKEWKAARYGKDWLVGDTINASIGQGYVLASPLQLAVMASRIASGRAVKPRLLRARDGIEVPVEDAPELDVKDTSLAMARKGMWAVVNGSHGTAGRSKIAAAEWTMAGKTGTSQVRSTVVNNNSVPWEQRDHALFVCFAPVDNPKYAVSLIVEHGGGGSTAAAPIARDIMLFALAGGLPPLAAYPSSQREQARRRLDDLDLIDPETIAPPTRSRA